MSVERHTRGQGNFDPDDGFGADYRAFYVLDLEQDCFTFEHDGHELVAQVFPAQGPPRGAATIVHGYYDHVGLYGHLIRELVGAGYTVYTYDQVGHGLSTGERATIDSFDRYVDALEVFLEHVPSRELVVGQSMGGSIVLELLDRHGACFGEHFLLAPLVRPFAWGANRIFYQVARPFVNSIGRKFAPNAANPEFAGFLPNDPLQARILPVAWVTAMVQWMKAFERRDPVDIPLSIVQGGTDMTVDGPHNLSVLTRRFQAAVLEIPEAHHHLVNEPEPIRSRVWDFLHARAADKDLPGGA